jgi:hypothetical protein
VKVIEPAVLNEAPQADSPFVTVMKLWARWNSLADRKESGGWSNPQDVKEFMRTGEAVEAMVYDLPSVNRWAIYRAFGIATVWRFPHLSLPDALLEAETKLTPKLLENVDTKRYFQLACGC